MANPDSALRQATEESILERLANGESLVQICKTPGMPSRMTVQRWQADDQEFDVAITRAREAGMFVRAENAVEAAKDAKDASLGRLAFDAERWYVGKLSNAFSDDKAKRHELTSPDGSMTPKGLDVSKLSDAALAEVLGAYGAPDT